MGWNEGRAQEHWWFRRRISLWAGLSCLPLHSISLGEYNTGDKCQGLPLRVRLLVQIP